MVRGKHLLVFGAAHNGMHIALEEPFLMKPQVFIWNGKIIKNNNSVI
jgi:hypothetical protein